MKLIQQKLKEVAISVVPLVVIVSLLQLILKVSTNNPVDVSEMIRFLISSVILIIGLTILIAGLELSINQIGTEMGAGILKSKKVWLLILIPFILGFIISAAEPDLLVLANQVGSFSIIEGKQIIKPLLMIMAISFGVGIMVTLSVLRIAFNIPYKYILYPTYLGLFALTITISIVNPDLLGIAFDSSGSVTGAVAVPFILAFGIGLSRSKKSNSEADSFGMVGLVSAGTIIAALIYMLFVAKYDFPPVENPAVIYGPNVIMPLIKGLPGYLLESFIALAPFAVLFLILQFTMLKLKKRQVIRIFKGLLYVFLGLTLFLTSANIGFMPLARSLGKNITEWGLIPTLAVSFIIGLVVILSESSVHVLTDQIKDVTSGSLKRLPVLIALSIGVGSALLLISLKVMVPGFELWMILIPLYLIAIILSFFTPNLFVGLGFDSGAVSSGPLAATFIYAFIQGIAYYFNSAITLSDAFGTIALVTVAPVIAIEILGIVYDIKTKKLHKEVVSDEKI